MSNKYIQDQTVYFRLGDGKPEGFAKVTGHQGFVVILQPLEKLPNYDFTHVYVVDSQIGEPPAPRVVEAEVTPAVDGQPEKQ